MIAILRIVMFCMICPIPAIAQTAPSSPAPLQLAQEDDAPKKKAAKKRKRKRKGDKAAQEASEGETTAANDTSSRAVRGRQKFTAAVRGGNLIGGFVGFGAEGLYHLNEDLLVGAFVATGSEDFLSALEEDDPEAVVVDKALVEFMMYYAQARYYIGNSFFVNGGLGMRNFQANFAASDDLAGRVEISTDATAVIGQFSIGNIWRWDSGFLIGAEWIGYNQPLTSSFTTTTSTEGAATALSEDFKESAVELAKLTSETGGAMTLVVSIGWGF